MSTADTGPADDAFRRADARARRRRRLRRLARARLLVPLLLVLGLAWLGWRVHQVQSHLSAARSELTAARGQLTGDGGLPTAAGAAAAQGNLSRAARDTAAARTASRDPLWSLVARVPVVGRPLRTAAGLAEVSDEVAGTTLPSLVRLSGDLDALRSGGANALPLPAIQELAPPLRLAAKQVDEQQYAVRHLPSIRWLSPLETARTSLADQLDQLLGPLQKASAAADLAPRLLGGDRPRQYLLVFEQPSETRPDGGLLGGWALLTADKGRLRVTRFGPNSTLPSMRGRSVQLDPDFQRAYGPRGAGSSWVNTNLSPDFGEDAAAWSAMSAAAHQPVDGVLSLDPEALGRLATLAQVTVSVPGAGSLNPQQLPGFLLTGQYALPVDKQGRKDLVSAAGAQVLTALQSRSVGLRPVADAAGELARDGHVKLWVSEPADEEVLSRYSLAGRVPDTDGEYAGVFVSNALGTKLDAYLDLDVTRTATCSTTDRIVTLTVRLRNDLPTTPLPTYVTRGDIVRPDGIPLGDNRIALTVLGTADGKLVKGAVDGVPAYDLSGRQLPLPQGAASLEPQQVRGHPGWRVLLQLPAHGERTVVLTLDEPREAARGHAVDLQALARTPRATFASC